MDQDLSGLLISPARANQLCDRAEAFWREFGSPGSRPKLVFGCNVYGRSILDLCSVDAFVDDFSTEPTFCGRPIVRTSEIAKDALVLAASGGRPLTVRDKLDKLGVEHLDYFSLCKWSGAHLREVVFNEGFGDEFLANEAQYLWAYELLADDISRDSFRKLVSFRLNCDIDVMTGFVDRQQEQYFEDFLDLHSDGEVFADIGAFHGETSLEFIKRCPQYGAIHLFEPDPMNFAKCKHALRECRDIQLWPIGASDFSGPASFAISGSTSGLSLSGTTTIQLARLDDVLLTPPSFLKMDIEGEERRAIAGAAGIIGKHRPKAAISVYHRAGDFWRIPKQLLSIYPRFDVYLRHYTESIYETVMFFVPRDPRDA